MTYQDTFEKFKSMFQDADVSHVKEHLAFQFNIEGEDAGVFYSEIKDGRLYIEPYEYHDRDAIFCCKSDVLFKIIEGKLDPVMAYTLHKIRVEGDLGKALKITEMIKKS